MTYTQHADSTEPLNCCPDGCTPDSPRCHGGVALSGNLRLTLEQARTLAFYSQPSSKRKAYWSAWNTLANLYLAHSNFLSRTMSKKGKKMSNAMILVEAAFHISRKKEEAARAALVSLALTQVGILDRRASVIQAWVAETGRNVDQLTLDEVVTCWGWQLLRNTAGTIFGIQLQEDFSSDERHLFEALSPFVTAGSFITLEGKHTEGEWRTCYGFTGSQVVELDALSPAVPLEKEEGGQGSKTSKKHSKRYYRKTLFWLRAIVAVTMQVLSEGDSEGQEYSVLDRVTIYEQAFAVIAAAIHQGLKPLENNTPDNVDQPISDSQAQEG